MRHTSEEVVKAVVTTAVMAASCVNAMPNAWVPGPSDSSHGSGPTAAAYVWAAVMGMVAVGSAVGYGCYRFFSNENRDDAPVASQRNGYQPV